jgi:hypothetical protein
VKRSQVRVTEFWILAWQFWLAVLLTKSKIGSAAASVVQFKKPEKLFTQRLVSCPSLHLFFDFLNGLHPVGALGW